MWLNRCHINSVVWDDVWPVLSKHIILSALNANEQVNRSAITGWEGASWLSHLLHSNMICHVLSRSLSLLFRSLSSLPPDCSACAHGSWRWMASTTNRLYSRPLRGSAAASACIVGGALWGLGYWLNDAVIRGAGGTNKSLETTTSLIGCDCV